MGLTDHPLATRLQTEANKAWFYGLSISILLSVYQLLFPPPSPTSQPEKQPSHITLTPPTTAASSNRTSALYEQLIIDAADLFLPGSALGWVPVSTLVVGIAGTVSTTVAGGQIWRRMGVEQRQREEGLAGKVKAEKREGERKKI
jgi:hypothetical protein